jgi:hypothetical protein
LKHSRSFAFIRGWFVRPEKGVFQSALNLLIMNMYCEYCNSASNQRTTTARIPAGMGYFFLNFLAFKIASGNNMFGMKDQYGVADFIHIHNKP